MTCPRCHAQFDPADVVIRFVPGMLFAAYTDHCPECDYDLRHYVPRL